MTNDGKELMQDLLIRASDKVELLQKAIIEKSFEVERLKAEVKQAKIDVLNKLKKYSYCDNDFMDGKWHRYVFVDDIEKLIEEVEKQ